VPEIAKLKARAGRPRNPTADKEILKAARTLLIEAGYGNVSMERVATRAGVGLQTAYRRWPAKAPLVAAAVLDAYETVGSLEPPDSADITADLRNWVRDVAIFMETPGNAALLRGLAAASATSPQHSDAMNDHIVAPQRRSLLLRLEKARAEGQIRNDADIESVADALLAFPIYRMLTVCDSTVEDTIKRFTGLADVLAAGIAPK
jgi:AcrR family transcriptional regulator